MGLGFEGGWEGGAAWVDVAMKVGCWSARVVVDDAATSVIKAVAARALELGPATCAGGGGRIARAGGGERIEVRDAECHMQSDSFAVSRFRSNSSVEL